MDIALILRTTLLIVAVVVNVLLAIIVYNNNPKSATNRVYALLSLVISAWLVINHISIMPAFQSTSLLWIRLSIFVATAMNTLFLLLALTLPSTKLRPTGWKLTTLVLASVGVMAVCLSPFAFTHVEIVNNAPQPVSGPGMAVFGLASIASNVLAIYVLMTKFKRSRTIVRQKLRYIMLGIITLLLLLLTTILIPVIVFKTSIFIAFLPLYTIIFLGLITYAIVRHRLFDIRILIAKVAAFTLVLSTLVILYAATLFGISSVFFLDTSSSFIENVTQIGLAIIMALTFQPLRRYFEKITDRIFFQDRYDAQTVLGDITSILAAELLLESLLDKTLKEICGGMRLASGEFIILGQNKLYKKTNYGKSSPKTISLETLQEIHHPILVTDELQSHELKDVLDVSGIRVVLMLRTHNEHVGYLLLGDKLSGEVYSSQDLAVLEILRKELAVAIVNAKAYEEIANFNVTLQERIKKATQRLSSANKNLKVLDKAKDDFISMASHQLGTPLTAITGYLSMAIDMDDKNLTPQQREFISYALEASERMVAMSSDLLNVSRLSSGRFNIQRQLIDLDKLTRQEVQQLIATAERKGLKLIYTSPSKPLPNVSIDESKTRQVIMNFIDNAIYYTPAGEIHVELKQDDDQVVLTVTDSGMGVPADERAKLFTKFYRAENAKTARPDGTGLGLYLAKRVIEEQGGAIIFSSTEGKGSTFGFALPLE